ncbi:MAG: hypothetical protein Q9188_001056 [Gyalolechia gomerana]
MPSLLSKQDILRDVFSTQTPHIKSASNPPVKQTRVQTSKPRRFSAWSAVDDMKSKAERLSNAAQKEISEASAAAQAKAGQIQLYFAKYYNNQGQGLTHTAITSLDLVRYRRQADAKMYKGNFEAWGKIGRAEGLRGSLLVQGAFKYGGYGFLKKYCSDLAGEEAAYRYKTGFHLAASASAELIADVALCPFEAVKVRMQTTIPPFASGTFSGISIITGREGTGLYPLWGLRIPYNMMKFASFETIVEAIYGYMPRKKSEYGKGAQTSVSFAGGCLAGILCAIVSHPADVMVSKLNANRQPGEAFGSATGRIYKDIGSTGLYGTTKELSFALRSCSSIVVNPTSQPTDSPRNHYICWYVASLPEPGPPRTICARLPAKIPSDFANEQQRDHYNVTYIDPYAIMPEEISHGRGGDQGDGPYSAGRGGAGNIESPRVKPTNVGGQRGDSDVIPETALREPGASYENYHTGRGGGGNVHKEKHDAETVEQKGLGEKLKEKIMGKKD